MFKNKKWIVLVTGVLAAIILAACATPTPETIVVTEIVEGEEVEVVITATPDPEAGDDMDGDDMDDAEAGTPADQFVTGIFSEPVTTNYWNYLGPGSDVWTGYALSGRIPAVYGLGDQRYDFVPSLAAGLPGDRTEDGDFVTIEVELLEGLTWSDGEALTAEDVAFTLDTVDRLNLGGNWATYNPEKFDRVEAVDETTLVYYFNDVPGLAEFEFGIALAPVLPEHYWAPIVEEAAAALEEVGEAPEAPGENATEDEQAAYDEELAAFQDAQEEARSILYQADVADEPVFGPYGNVEYEPGAFAAKQALDNYYFTGSQTTLYANGAYQTILPDGTEQLFYGDASGDVALELETGPFVNEVIYSIYGSQDAAFLALQDGEIDYVFSPLGLSQGLRNTVQDTPGLNIAENDQNGFRYLAFNTRVTPMNDVAFRQAVATVVDQGFITQTILGGAALPVYSMVPPGNGFWHNPDVTRWGFDDEGNSLDRQARFEAAKQILVDAGYSWDGEEPVWDEDSLQVARGGTLVTPDGTVVEELQLLAPNAGYDPLRATSAIWVEEFTNDLGIPVVAELVPFSAIVPVAFAEGEEAANWDMYILGWGLGGVYPDFMDNFFHTRNDSAEGGFNTPGYSNPEFDAVTDEFLAATDIEEAQSLAFQMQEILANDVPYVLLFTNPIYDVYRENVEFPYTEVLDGIQGFNGLIGGVRVFE